MEELREQAGRKCLRDTQPSLRGPVIHQLDVISIQKRGGGGDGPPTTVHCDKDWGAQEEMPHPNGRTWKGFMRK
jgi:hypothetical protein